MCSRQRGLATWRQYLPGLCLCLSWVSQGSAENNDGRVLFDVAPQPLEDALIVYSNQSGVQVISASDSLNEIYTGGIAGRYDPRRALGFLLADSGLSYDFSSDLTAVVWRASRRDQRDDPSMPIEVTVSAAGSNVAAGLDDDALRDPQSQVRTEAATEPRLEEVVATGTRIARQSGMTSPMPLTVLTSQAVQFTMEQNVNDILLQLPQLQVGNTLQTGRATTSQGGGTSNANLRRLGVERTLVLVNGRRHVGGAGLTTAVDLNTIPVRLIERIEVVTGGTSAIYGADAVSGVVNLVLEDDLDGFELDVQTGITDQGDGETYALNFLAGANFDNNRGRTIAAFNYDRVARVEAKDRNYGVNRFNTIRNPSFAPDPFNIHASPITFFFASDEGHFSFLDISPNDPTYFANPNDPHNSPFDSDGDWSDEEQIFDADGLGLRPFDFGDHTSFGRILNGDGGDFERFDQLRQPVERYIVSGSVKYAISDDTELFFEGKYARTENGIKFQPVEDPLTFGFAVIRSGNPFLPPAAQALLDERNLLALPLRKIWTQFGQRGTDIVRDTYQLTLGFDGTLSNAWNWGAVTSLGRTDDTTQQLNNRLQQEFEESLDAVLLDGEIVCADPRARARGCRPLNPFGIDTADPAAVEYSRIDTVRHDRTKQRVFAASISGSLARLPAGALAFASGLEYREESGSARPSAIQQLGLSLLPIQQITVGEYDVREIYLELVAPLLSAQPLADYLAVETAVREADYSVTGANTSWHIGLDWVPFADLRFRIVRSAAIRAPNLGELFNPELGNFQFIDDPCDISLVNAPGVDPNRASNCHALGLPLGFIAPTNGVSIFTTSGGNRNLEVESAETLTAGFIFTPRRVPNLSLIFDYWDIELSNAITTLGGDIILTNCVDAPSLDNDFCDLVTRDPSTGGVSNILDVFLNAAAIKTSGFDIEANYTQDLSNWFRTVPGVLDFNVIGSRIHSRRFFADQRNPNDAIEFAGFVPLPKWRVNLRATYRHGPLLVSLQTRFIDAMRADAAQTNATFDRDDTGDRYYVNLFSQYALSNRLSLRFGINNLTDKPPPNVTFGNSGIRQGIRDAGALFPNLGRTFFLGVTMAAE